ncbi:threonine synthase [Halopiger xanaduensis]|uniref:Threonine synthase n=1 Tax=Halopiger xanaduensis (strain DSM 18323 / JCM 14033 / SH-6) TaxID=797210 RepID=F8D8Q1_HALXS|nr:threonine synthase [Halopiger xanaduensis]AEH36810.1 threonine synthase [Halopiger xanaduensis SH-6]
MDRQVRCYDCGKTYRLEERQRCSCGEPLWFDADAETFEWPDDDRNWTAGMWRYEDALPVAPSSAVPTGSVPGTTPLVRAEGLDEYAGCRLSLKPEGQNPTGSFKDRGTAVGVEYGLRDGHDWIGTVSHGNMALSTSAYAAAAGLEAAVFVPADTPLERLELIARHGARIFRVEGDYGRLYAETLGLEAEVGRFVNSDTPLRVAGQKTVAYEILEQFQPSAPDAIVLPVSSGGQASGVWKALRELEAAGLLDADDVPRLYLVQAAACDPIATASREGRESVSAIEPGETIAVSIANADPPSGTRALTAARETGGAVVSVPDEATREAMDRLATAAGISVEPSSAVALAGVRELSRRGELDADEEVVTILTGSGYKERYDVDVESRTRTIDLEAVERELAAALE